MGKNQFGGVAGVGGICVAVFACSAVNDPVQKSGRFVSNDSASASPSAGLSSGSEGSAAAASGVPTGQTPIILSPSGANGSAPLIAQPGQFSLPEGCSPSASSTAGPVEGALPDAGLPDAGLPDASAQLVQVVDDLTLLVVFDNSGSMDTQWECQTRWQAANLALVGAIEPAKASLKVGAIRFPMGESCGVPPFTDETQFGFKLGEAFLEEWTARALLPTGGTPLAQALLAADVAIANAGEMGLLAQRFRVVVVTDGEPNCDGDVSLLTSLPAKWRERGVETHVLGLPGSTGAAALLDSVAEAGGGHHFQITTPGELAERAQQLAS
jgi:hypothetical protein